MAGRKPSARSLALQDAVAGVLRDTGGRVLSSRQICDAIGMVYVTAETWCDGESSHRQLLSRLGHDVVACADTGHTTAKWGHTKISPICLHTVRRLAEPADINPILNRMARDRLAIKTSLPGLRSVLWAGRPDSDSPSAAQMEVWLHS